MVKIGPYMQLELFVKINICGEEYVLFNALLITPGGDHAGK
jgi:hypothetical protein